MTGAIKGVINMTKIQNEVQTIPHLLEKYRESEALAVICGDEACHDRKRGDFRTYSASCEDRGGGETVFIYGASELFGPALYQFGSAYDGGELTPGIFCQNG